MKADTTRQEAILADFFYGDEAEQFSYFRIPRLLITSPRFRSVSTEAKLLYGMLLDRMSLSRKKGWSDSDGKVYIFYTVEEIAEDLNCGREKAINLLAELDDNKGVGLVVKKRQGQGKPSKLYVKRFTSREPLQEVGESRLLEVGKSDFKKLEGADLQKSENQTSRNRTEQTSRSPKNRLLEVGKSDCSYTEYNYPDSIYPESVNPSIVRSTENLAPAHENADDGLTDGRAVRERIKKQIEFDIFPYRAHSAPELRQAAELLELMVEVALTQSATIKIGQGEYPSDYVKERFAMLRCDHIEQVLIGLNENAGRVTNVRAYMLASLFNATASLESACGLSAAYG